MYHRRDHERKRTVNCRNIRPAGQDDSIMRNGGIELVVQALWANEMVRLLFGNSTNGVVAYIQTP